MGKKAKNNKKLSDEQKQADLKAKEIESNAKLSSGKKAITNKILSDAQKRADAMVGEAEAKAQEILAETASLCKRHLEKSQSEVDEIKVNIATRSKTVAELDAKKLLLKAKADMLDKTFDTALDKIRNLDAKAYKKLILGMLANAEDGDVITISQREKKIITKKLVDEEAKKRGIKLTLNKELGDFDGGLILSSGGVDKNFTLDVELGLLRDTVEADIAKELID